MTKRPRPALTRPALTGLAIIYSLSLLLFCGPCDSQTGASARAARQSANKAIEMAPYVETIPGTNIKFEMAPVPGGTFMMGSPPAEPGRSTDEGPQREVVIRPFWMGRFEVTWDEYDQFAFNQGIAGNRVQGGAQQKGPADAVTRPTPPYADESF